MSPVLQRIFFLALAATALVGPAVADPFPFTTACTGALSTLPACAPALTAPQNLEASYDAATGILTLSWSAPSSGSPTSYNVYRDDSRLGDSTTTTYDEDISDLDGVHYYYVTAVTSGTEGGQSNTLWLVKTGGVPPDCPVADVSIYTNPPGATPGIHWDCLP